ncbi:MAG: hypothetical protein RL347_1226 [Actinomycetota bacterium]|jgi:hypothetical protein
MAFGTLIPAFTLVLAWVFALLGITAPGAVPDDTTWDSVMRWLLFLPAGCMYIASAVMHTVFAKRTAANIGWQTNGFQYEIGFASLGMGIAGIIAGASVPAAWLPVAVAGSIFLVLAGANHIREMIKDKNVAAGNTLILIYDFGLPISFAIAFIGLGSA